MAAAGPAASVVLGVGFLLLASAAAGPVDLGSTDPRALLSSFGPLATLLFWLGEINIVIALFNLVPGFPLDGGRVLRAALWGITGDQELATRWASLIGQAFAWFLIASGLAMMLGVHVPLFGSGVVGGLWLAFIGWFLNNAALGTYQQLLVQRTLGGVRVEALMDRGVASVEPGLSVEALVDGFLLRGEQRSFPVLDGDTLVGLVCLDDVRRLARADWPSTPVA